MDCTLRINELQSLRITDTQVDGYNGLCLEVLVAGRKRPASRIYLSRSWLFCLWGSIKAALDEPNRHKEEMDDDL